MLWWQWLVILIFWNAVGIFIIATAVGSSNYGSAFHKIEGFEVMNPRWWYNNTNVNPFGAVICTLGFTIVCPIGAIGYWFYKLCTIGGKRK